MFGAFFVMCFKVFLKTGGSSIRTAVQAEMSASWDLFEGRFATIKMEFSVATARDHMRMLGSRITCI